MLTSLEKKVIAAIQGDIPITPTPYRDMAKKLDISEEEFLNTLRALCKQGVIRRFGATLRHQKTGFAANAMTAWKVDEARVEEIGKKMAAHSAVSHCYRRDPAPDWPYNLYTMIHAPDITTCRDIARQLSAATGVKTYKQLFSHRELKKTSMVYFPD
ncbi:MAG: Lrp/AsnC family transcriptional regulator [Deltaproteobacteria bacterium]|nr:MAG: Lrp/AsnC family transcriptional regulator [Deltaproteobacteria bacterium]